MKISKKRYIFVKKMKKIFVILFIALISQNLFSQQEIKDETLVKKQGKVVFKSTVYDFGKIPYDSDATAIFKFKNTNKNPVLISNVKTSCGCTVADWTKTPVKRNKKGTITAKYNTKSVGKFHKTVSVFFEGEPQAIQLEIKGEVLNKVE